MSIALLMNAAVSSSAPSSGNRNLKTNDCALLNHSLRKYQTQAYPVIP